MKRLTRVFTAATAATLALGLAACGGGGAGGGDDVGTGDGDGAAAASDITVGVAMPTQTSERWIADGNSVREGLEEAGFEVNLQFANDDIPTQQQQIDQMITQGADILIVASIDGTALANQLQAAADAGIPIISYDRLIRDTENVDFYVTFDNFQVGVDQATSLLTGLGVLDADGNETGETGPFTIELFAGSLDDNNAHFFFDGAMTTLQPFIDAGTLVVGSGQTSIDQAATLRWSQETAQRRMEDLLTAHYGGGSEPLHGVLSPFDGISRGIITALQNAGMGPSIADGLPVVTGQDAEIASVALIDQGIQYSTIFKDTRLLAEQAVIAAQAFADGRTPEANNTTDYDNGMMIVPSFLLPVSIVTADDIQSVLIDSGFFTQEQVDRGQM
ncbi:xylose ABC transporter, substrate-binding protein [Xylanimonas cellulosilytica DSM 15894]|uniref:Xylose ABC transporter, substrate-binding protein n=1 Tax=Xylanimonas cellulosilytica (strain DSM 15894 / JCM 12276 / CECT 5975 / KCTC 9989 / LMG 20990 / NBRC 107835 / XIL07) TaxID=446471 RepID=D1BVH2_XYLCX|nr:multiple monosaccharide ABC transporter substrate-binding protein [Xylanimonas cellulosilytica]ACZ29443.1 xylose ABC transporter, substrate-binding protein [Xylanimonas cellulosilytica DSM 15894]